MPPRAIAEAEGEGRVPILVGGTGLYFKALLEGLSPVPDVPAEIRELGASGPKASAPKGSTASLQSRDPVMAARLSPTDPQRVVRALEVIDATGVSLAEWQGTAGTPVLRSEAVLKLVVAPEREPLYAAIDARFERMIEAGRARGGEGAAALHLDHGLPAMRAHGVRELAAYLAGA